MNDSDSLGSIHYNEGLILDLWTELERRSGVEDASFKIIDDSKSTTFETQEELENAVHLSDRIFEFTFALQADEGELEITCLGGEHKYSVVGEETWVRSISHFLEDFISERQNKLRTFLSNKRLLGLQLILFGALIGSSWHKIYALITPFYTTQISPAQWQIITGFLLAILLIQAAKHVYPSVVYYRRGSEPRLRQVVFIVMLLGSIASLAQWGIYLI